MIPPAQLSASVRALPALSHAIARVHALAADARASAADFEALIRPDAALSANLLRIANSAQFARRGPVTTVRQAVAVLGLRRLCDVATAASFAPVIPATLPGYGVDSGAFWLHSVAVAILAERLAARGGPGGTDEVFTAALLHDVGKLALTAFVGAASRDILVLVREGRRPLVVAEREVLGVDHAEAGGAVAEAWALPPAARWAARWHHEPDAAPEGPARRICALVHTADALAHSLGLGTDAGELAREIDPAAARLAGASSRVLEHVACECLEPIHEMGRLFAPRGDLS